MSIFFRCISNFLCFIILLSCFVFAQKYFETPCAWMTEHMYDCLGSDCSFLLSCFPAAVASLCSCVKKGIECWSSSGFPTPSITSISAGGRTITDSKIFQSPLKKKTHIKTQDGDVFLNIFIIINIMVSQLLYLDKKYLENPNYDKNKNPIRLSLPQLLVYVKFGVQSCLKD